MNIGSRVIVILILVFFICSVFMMMMMVVVVVVIMLGMIDSLMNLSIVSVVGVLIKIINGVVDTSNVLGNCSKGSDCLTETLRDKAQSMSKKLNFGYCLDMVKANDMIRLDCLT